MQYLKQVTLKQNKAALLSAALIIQSSHKETVQSSQNFKIIALRYIYTPKKFPPH